MPRATREALEDLHLECLEVIEHFTIDEKLIEILNMGLLLGGVHPRYPIISSVHKYFKEILFFSYQESC